jgi:membrane dipeptidase
MEVSSAPVAFSHSNAKAVCASARNLADDQIRAVAAMGGVIGMNGFPAFVAPVERPTIDHLIAHVDHIAGLVGPRHIGLGLDYYEGMASVASLEQAQAAYRLLVDSGTWQPDNYPPPPWHYPQGIEEPSGLPRLTEALVARGYKDEDIVGILGGNFLRVFRQVWG